MTRTRHFTLAIDDDCIVIPLATLRYLHGQLEDLRQGLLRIPGQLRLDVLVAPPLGRVDGDAELRGGEVMDAEIRAVQAAIEEELDSRHPRPITLAGREAHAVYLVASRHIENVLTTALERHLGARGLLDDARELT